MDTERTQFSYIAQRVSLTMENFNLGADTISDSLKILTVEKDGDEDFESPFNWCIPEQEKQLSDEIIKKATNDESYDGDEKVFDIFRYTNLIVLIYEHTIRKEQDQALLYLKMCEETLLKPQNASDEFYKSIERAIWHVFLATRAQLVNQKNTLSHPGFTTVTITPWNEMNNVEKAGILGIKTMVLMTFSSLIDIHFLLETIREAISLNPNEGVWYHREGIILRAIQNRNRYPKTDDRYNVDQSLKLEAFKKAFDLNPNNLSYFIHYAKELIRADTTELNEFELSNHWGEFLRVYNKILNLRPECPFTIHKAAKFFRRLPHQYRNTDEIMELLLNAEKIAPTFYQIPAHLGWIYKNVIRDLDKACPYFEHAIELGSHRANYFYVMVKLSMDRDFNPIPILEKAREKVVDDWRRAECTVNIACCYLFIYDDVDSALDQFFEAFEKYPQSQPIKEVKPVCLNINRPCSSLELVHNILNENHKNAPRRDEILKKVYEIDPELEKEPPCRHYWKDAHFNLRMPRQHYNYHLSRHNDRRIQDEHHYQSSPSNSNWREKNQSVELNNQYERNSTEPSYTNGSSRRSNQGQTNDSACETSGNDYNSLFYPHFNQNENQRQMSSENHQRLRKYDGNQSQWNTHDNQRTRDYSRTQYQMTNRNQQLRNTRNWRNTSPAPEGSWRR